MKTQIFYLFILLTVFASCSSEFTDLAPVSDIATSNFYKTGDDFKNAVSGAYSSLQFGGTYGGNYYVFGDIPSDDSKPVVSGSVTDQDEFDRFYIRTTNPYTSGCWNDCYKGIARCNAILDRIDAVDLNADLKNQYIGESKFVRALIYFKLVRVFGDVPLIVNEITNPDQGYEFGRSPKAEVYAQIEKDLAEAASVLPAVYKSDDIGRATKGAANALLGRVLLYQKKYSEAAIKLKLVVDSGIYDLLPTYGDCFKASGKNHKESVFDVQYKSGGLGEGNSLPNSFAPENSGNAVIKFGGGGNNRPTPDLESEYEAGDLRKDATMATSYISEKGVKVDYYFCKKYWDTPATSGDNNNNYPIVRYSDVLLMYAECLNESGYQANGDAFNYLNRIRNRAGLASKTGTDIPTQAAFRLAMEHERRVEFAFEGLRWFDLVRTDRAIPVLNSKSSQIGILTPPLNQNNLVFPIPQSQIDINSEKITQNPGY